MSQELEFISEIVIVTINAIENVIGSEIVSVTGSATESVIEIVIVIWMTVGLTEEDLIETSTTGLEFVDLAMTDRTITAAATHPHSPNSLRGF